MKIHQYVISETENLKVQIEKKKLKNILNNAKSNCKAQATATFSILYVFWRYFLKASLTQSTSLTHQLSSSIDFICL